MRVPGLQRFFVAGGMFLSALLVGTVGYRLLEDFTWLEAAYMTMITISTVGFGELHELSPEGRLFTTMYIFINLGVLAYVLSVITSFLFDGELRHFLRLRKRQKKINQMENHVIVCGFGRNGRMACKELADHKRNFVVVEKNQELIDKYQPTLKYNFLAGDAGIEDTLLTAGVERASCMIITLPDDADNVFITLTGKGLNPNLNVIARATNENTEAKLLRAGAKKVVIPEMIGGVHMARLVIQPQVIEFLDMVSGVGKDSLSMQQYSYELFKDKWKGSSLKDMDVRKNTGATVIGFRDQSGQLQVEPRPDTCIDPTEMMIILGNREALNKFRKEYLTH